MLSDLELAASLVREAGTLAAEMLAKGLETKHKTSVSDVVSAADHAAEELVESRLAAERPDDGVVGEEGASRPGARTWYIDPVDGTYNFLAGMPSWCSALSLEDEDGLVLGAVYQPATDELWLGGRDQPTTLNGVPVGPLPDAAIGQLSIATYLHPARLGYAPLRESLLAAVAASATTRMLGSGSIELSYVATGRLGCFVQANSLPWDWTPGAALVRAAGGAAEVIECRGEQLHIAGNKQAVAELIEIVQAA